MDSQVAPQTDLKTLAQAYLDAFHARDLDRCLEFYADDATVDFNKTVYSGRQGITEWHKDRFAADLRLIKMNSMTVEATPSRWMARSPPNVWPRGGSRR
jgi:ketosteroid isomerase-like protein